MQEMIDIWDFGQDFVVINTLLFTKENRSKNKSWKIALVCWCAYINFTSIPSDKY